MVSFLCSSSPFRAAAGQDNCIDLCLFAVVALSECINYQHQPHVAGSLSGPCGVSPVPPALAVPWPPRTHQPQLHEGRHTHSSPVCCFMASCPRCWAKGIATIRYLINLYDPREWGEVSEVWLCRGGGRRLHSRWPLSGAGGFLCWGNIRGIWKGS